MCNRCVKKGAVLLANFQANLSWHQPKNTTKFCQANIMQFTFLNTFITKSVKYILKKMWNVNYQNIWSIHWIYWNQIHKLNTKTQIFLITFNFCILTLSPSVFLSPPVKVYKKVVKFSFTKQKIFWVLVFGFMYLASVDLMDRSNISQQKVWWM